MESPSFKERRHLRYRLRDIDRRGAAVRYLTPPDEPRVVTVQRVEGLNRWLDNPCSEEAGS